jgi:hypothetical protein
MKRTSHSYYVVMIDFGKRGLEAIVDPEITRRGIVDRIRTKEYQNIAFIHHVEGLYVYDCTDELMHDAGVQLEAAE